MREEPYSKPAIIAVALRTGAVGADIVVPFDPLEVSAHGVNAPSGIFCQICDVLPIVIWRKSKIHRIVVTAAT